MHVDRVVATNAIIFVLSIAFLTQFFWKYFRTYDAAVVLDGIPVDEKLQDHSKEFDQPFVYQVTDEVYVAVGYAIANSILLVAPEGAIIVDTTESVDAAREIAEEFRKITDKPIKAVIYTHSHGDHILGTEGFLEDPENPPDIWGHHSLPTALESWTRAGPRGYRGAQHQFGMELGGRLVNAGLGPFLRMSKGGSVPKYLPNRFLYKQEEDIVIAGMKLRLVHIPGETPDQMAVWLPETKVLLPADNVYKAFPNLYAIRGTPPRNILHWATSVKRMRDLGAEHLVPSHTRPLSGREVIYNLLTDYKDAIQFVHDQSLRYINQGLHPTEVAEKVRLPERLAKHPHLLEFYGTVEWSVRAVYDMYFGWFSGDPLDLAPLSHRSKAEKMVELVGGQELMSAARRALSDGEVEWALELASYLFIRDPDDVKAREVRLEALRALAARQRSAPGRNFYSTVALHDHKLIDSKLETKKLTLSIPLHYMFEGMKVRLKAELVVDVVMKIVIEFTDVNEFYTLMINNCVLDVDRKSSEKYDLKLTTKTIVWREIVAGVRSPAVAYTNGDIVVDGSVWTLRDFQSYFEKPE